MALIVEDGSGLTNSESYISVADADTYHTNHRDPSAWSNATEARKEAALREATQYINGFYQGRWKGTRVRSTQRLSWPREDVWLDDDYTIPSNELPEALTQATAEAAALAISRTNGLMPVVDEQAGIKRERDKADVLETEVEYFTGKTGLPRLTVLDMLLATLLSNSREIHRA